MTASAASRRRDANVRARPRLEFQPGQSLLIETQAAKRADPPIRQIVQLLEPATCRPGGRVVRPLYSAAPDPPGSGRPGDCADLAAAAMEPTAVTPHLLARRRRADRGPRPDADHAGRQPGSRHAGADRCRRELSPSPRRSRRASTPDGDRPHRAATTLPDGTSGATAPIYLYTLSAAPLAWLAQPASIRAAMPCRRSAAASHRQPATRSIWSWFRWLLDAGSSTPLSRSMRPVIAPSAATPTTRSSYDTTATAATRCASATASSAWFPTDGAHFTVTYRVGDGAAGNVAADAITPLDPAEAIAAGLFAVTNPLAAPAAPIRSRWRASAGSHRRHSAAHDVSRRHSRQIIRRQPKPCPGCSGPARSSAGPGAG